MSVMKTILAQLVPMEDLQPSVSEDTALLEQQLLETQKALDEADLESAKLLIELRQAEAMVIYLDNCAKHREAVTDDEEKMEQAIADLVLRVNTRKKAPVFRR